MSKVGNIQIKRPEDKKLYPFIESSVEMDEFDPEHPLKLNTSQKHKKKIMGGESITCFEFFDEFVFSGFGDGLICCWHTGPIQAEDMDPDFIPLLGHSDKINQLKTSLEVNRMFSCSDDQTLRQWSLDQIGVCERIFKFPDPVTCCIVNNHMETTMLFTGCQDKMIRAMILETGVIDRAFVASREAIRCLH